MGPRACGSICWGSPFSLLISPQETMFEGRRAPESLLFCFSKTCLYFCVCLVYVSLFSICTHQALLCLNDQLPRPRSESERSRVSVCLFSHSAPSLLSLLTLRSVWLVGDGVLLKGPPLPPHNDSSNSRLPNLTENQTNGRLRVCLTDLQLILAFFICF